VRRRDAAGKKHEGILERDPSKRGDGGVAYRSGVGARMEGGRSRRRQSWRQRGEDVGRIVGDAVGRGRWGHGRAGRPHCVLK
jgi:hypothetical protein